jgi:thioredoxin
MSEALHIVCPHCDAVNRVPGERLPDQPVCGRCTRTLFSGKPLEVTTAQFDKHLSRNDIPVLVDFWATWCGPCKMVAPVLEEIAGEKAGSLTVAKLDVDSNPATARDFQVVSIPTMILFKDGKPVKRIVGAKGKAALLRELEDVV